MYYGVLAPGTGTAMMQGALELASDMLGELWPVLVIFVVISAIAAIYKFVVGQAS